VNDELLGYYNCELAYLRSMGAEFARRHGKIAARLELGPTESRDPHVERLLQGVAFLNARIQRKLDDDFPEISESLLGVIYPHYIRPTPSLAIVQFHLSAGARDLSAGHSIDRGTYLDTEPELNSGARCRFRTAAPVHLWPCSVRQASFQHRPFAAPPIPGAERAQAVLRLQLRSLAKGLRFSQFPHSSLRFYLHAGQTANVGRLYELLFTRSVGVAIAASESDGSARMLRADKVLQPVGFSHDERLLPWDARSFLGYRLLAEYFALPQRFLFFDLTGLEAALARIEENLEIYVFFDRQDSELQRSVSASTLRLGCTPVVNLFPERMEPQILTQTQTEYPVAPPARGHAAPEIYAIDRVEASLPNGERTEYQPFYGFKHAADRSSQRTFWHARRRPPSPASKGLPADQRRDLCLSFVDLDFTPTAPAEATLHVQATCFDGDRPSRLPSSAGRPRLELAEGGEVVGQVECLVHPTRSVRPDRGYGAMWRLISHLALNHLSLTEGEEGAHALREILRLYDAGHNGDSHRDIDGIRSVTSRPVIRRLGRRGAGFGQGVQVELELDETQYVSGNAYLFASVLDRFLGLYAAVNSFSELVAQCQQRRGQEKPWKWPLRSGEQNLL
jgi:type VI secretion system protein ImpG